MDKITIFYFMYLRYVLKEKLLLQENKVSIFIKLVPKIDKGSNLGNWIFKRFFDLLKKKGFF